MSPIDMPATSEQSTDMPETPTLGQRVRQAREAAGLTRERAAVAADVAVRTLVRLEADERPIRPALLARIAETVGLDLESVA